MYDFNVLKVENCVHELSSSLLERVNWTPRPTLMNENIYSCISVYISD